ncbi:uncharacterized protein [Nicotiana tomentosiformis]|uniref:uncharacterized protein n=1 Tax=Nicotiana tomentosiformis TaxID=4098 RepID=UPI00388CC044
MVNKLVRDIERKNLEQDFLKYVRSAQEHWQVLLCPVGKLFESHRNLRNLPVILTHREIVRPRREEAAPVQRNRRTHTHTREGERERERERREEEDGAGVAEKSKTRRVAGNQGSAELHQLAWNMHVPTPAARTEKKRKKRERKRKGEKKKKEREREWEREREREAGKREVDLPVTAPATATAKEQMSKCRY